MTDAQKIVVGVDGSDGSAAALRWAVAQSSRRGWPVIAVLAWDHLRQYFADREQKLQSQYKEAHARIALEAYVQDAVGELVSTVELRTPLDQPVDALLAAAEGEALLVVGARGLGGVKRLLLGSVSSHCLHHSITPVAVIRDGEEHPGRGRIVVGIDGSANSLTALRWAAHHAIATGDALEVVHAWHPPFVTGAPYVVTPLTIEDGGRAARAVLDLAAQTLEGLELATPPTETFDLGGAAPALVEASERASLVVVGGRGLGGFASLLLGSVSDQVSRHAHCPVVVVPGSHGEG